MHSWQTGLANTLPYHSPADVLQWKRLRVESTNVLHGDLTVAPDSADYWVELLAPQTPKCHAQVSAFNHKGQRAFVHVQNNQERIRHQEDLVSWTAVTGVGDSGVVLNIMVKLVSAQVPSPGLAVAAHQGLVANRVKWGVPCGHTHHSMCAPLPRTPTDFPHVKPSCITHLATNAVCALSNRVSVEGEPVIFLDKNV